MHRLPIVAVTAADPLSWQVLVAVGALAGLVAAVVMDWPMSRQPDGFTPAAVAAGIVTRQPVEAVSFPELLIVHHAAGLLAGVLYGVVVLGVASGLPELVRIGGLDLVAHLLAVGLVVGFIYVFFAHFVLRRAGGKSYEEQATAIRGQWLRSSLVFGLTLAVVVPLVALSLAG
ncbi:hypothetical protein [Halohasta litorea]|uniref:Uncharacterized protein n=1 Tax=Halohasta litorea TaxID=869891 RepID=A0ABD6D834_9EURY|nr:hypothetical protein [Halohasta litorea]MEA1932498.1 hypothetical protein [Euryarchaeota archaeon]